MLRNNLSQSRVRILFLAACCISPILQASSSSTWYASANAGGQVVHSDQITVSNGSGFPAPYDQDLYLNRSPSSVVAGIGAGYRFTDLGLPATSVGIEYTHLFNVQTGNQIMQYSLPQFINYTYRWNVASDVVLLSSKLNFIRWANLLPYVKGGIGMGFNQANSYLERALPGVTSRISPGFGNRTTTVFAYRLGVGLDWEVKSDLFISLGYEFTDLGKFRSASGINSWQGDVLSSEKYTSNSVVLGFTYLFNKS